MVDAVVVSDIHLGSDVCRADSLVRFLDEIRHGHRPAARLVVNGDLFDSIDFRRLTKRHWKVLSTLRKMSDDMEVVWIIGNHDGPAEFVSHLLGVEMREEYVIESGGRRVLLLHGHRFDGFIDRYPWATWAADMAYRLLQLIDPSHRVARLAKRNSKVFIRSTEKIRAGATELARRRGCDVVCCGHTHLALADTAGPVDYYNGGCWTEKPCHYLVIDAGRVEVHAYDDAAGSSGATGFEASMSIHSPTPTK